MMQDIYRSASSTVVFLGHDISHRIDRRLLKKEPGERIIFDADVNLNSCHREAFLQRWSSNAKKSFTPTPYDLASLISTMAEDTGRTLEHLATMDPDALRTLVEGLRMMTLCPWWTRIWIVQEMVVSREVSVRYGNVEVPWRVFLQAATGFINYSADQGTRRIPAEFYAVFQKLFGMVRDLMVQRENWVERSERRIRSRPGNELLQLLRSFRSRGASDDRDKVYALLGLAGEIDLFPDYSLDVKSVYVYAISEIIAKTASLECLCGDIGRKNRQDIPSWVPDWSAIFNDEGDNRRAALLNEYNACKGFRAVLGKSSHGFIRDRIGHLIEKLQGPDHGSLQGIRLPSVETLKRLLEEHITADPFISDVLVEFILTHPGAGREFDITALYDISWGQSSKASVTVSVPVNISDASQDEALTLSQAGLGLQTSAFFADKVVDVCEPLYSIESMNEVHARVRLWNQLFLDRWLTNRRSIYESAGRTDPSLEEAENGALWILDSIEAFGRAILFNMKQQGHGTQYMRIDADADRVNLILWLCKTFLSLHQLWTSLQSFKQWDDLNSWFEDAEEKYKSPEEAENADEQTKQASRQKAFSEFEEAFRRLAPHRSFFVTDGGLPGMGPPSMQYGDRVFVLPGSRTPFVLRLLDRRRFLRPRSSDWSDCYQLIGDCYLQGAMDGEMLPKSMNPETAIFPLSMLARMGLRLPANFVPNLVIE